MPTSSPHPALPDAMKITGRHARLAAFLLLCAVSAASQTLAHPGLVGNGLNADPWWQHAVFYEVRESPAPASTDYKAITGRLETLRNLGVDALIVPMPSLAGQSPQTSAPPSSPHPDSPVDDFDDLIHQASLHGIRVLVTLSASNPTNDLSGLARLWLSHGVAGLNITTSPNSSPQTTQAIVQSMRRIAAAAVGQRIVLSALDPSTLPATPTAASPRRSVPIRNDRSLTAAGPQLQIDSRLGQVDPPDAATLRTVLTQAASQPNVLLDVRPASSTASPDPHPALVDAMAAIAMTNRPTALIDADDRLALEPDPAPAPPTPPPAPAPPPPQPPSGTYVPFVPLKKPAPAPAPHVARPSPLAAWYTQLALLHHSNATLRYGATTVLNFDAQNALVWVARPAVNSPLTPAVVVACNLSPNPVQLSLTSAMKTLDLHGFFLRTLARSDNGMGAQNLDSVTLPPFAVYIGELRR